MSDNKKWVNLGDISPHFRLEGKKLQIKYPEEDWQDLADFSDVAPSLDLRLNDETNAVEVMQSNGEWAVLLDLSKVGGGIKTVQTYRDLPADAKEGDVCLVLEDGYGEDEWQPLTIEDIGYERVSQIRFRDTIEESLSATGFDFDSHISVPLVLEEPLVVFYCKNGKAFYLCFAYTKTDGISSTVIMLMDEDEDEYYILGDNIDALNSDMTLPDGIVVGKWNRITESSLTVLDTAPAFDVVSLCSYATQIEESTSGESKKIYENFCLSFSYEKSLLPLIEANVSTKQNKGLYTYDGEKWRCNESNDVVLYEEIFEDEDGEKSDLIDFLDRQALFDKTASVYACPRKSTEVPSNLLNSWGSLNSLFFINGTDYSSSSINHWLNESVSDETIEAFNGKTIVFTESLEENVARAAISCTNGMILICIVDSAERFAVYNSQAGAEFNPEIFKDVCSDYEQMPTAILNETGWYICICGLFAKAETRFTVKDVVGDIYEKRTSGSNYLVDGITSEIPDVEGEGDTISFNSLFMYVHPAFSKFLSSGEIVSYVYEVPCKFNVYFASLGEFRILSNSHRLKEIDNSHRHDNLYQINKAAETWHEHKDLDYLESLVDSHDYSKVFFSYDNLFILTGEADNPNLTYYDAEGTSPEVFKNMHTVGTPYPFWTKVRGKVFYDWGLYAPHITEVNDSESDLDFVKTNMCSFLNSYGGPIMRRQFLHLIKKYVSEFTDISSLFACSDLLIVPELDISNATKAYETLAVCDNLRCVNNWDLSSLENTEYMCRSSSNLQYFNPTNEYDCYICLPSIQNMKNMFCYCRGIKSMCIDFGGNSVSSSIMEDAFYVMSALTDINFVNGSIKVDGDFAPFGTETTTSTNSKTGVTTTTNVFTSVLSADSIVNFLNYLEDNTGGTQYTVTVPKTPYDLLTDEQKAIATNKNIILKGE